MARIRIPCYAEQEENVRDAIRRGQLVHGPHLDLLERRLSDLFGKKHVVLTANGFSALFLALRAEPPAGKDVLTASASTCSAVVNAIRAAGLRPVFSDVEFDSAGIGPLRPGAPAALAVVPDHFGILAPACKDVRPGCGRLIEDAAQAFHSRVRNRSRADVLVLSFYPTKWANGIDGGAILADDAEFAARCRRLGAYSDQRGWEQEVRYNLRMNNVNAAMALGTLAHLDEEAERLGAVFGILAAALRKRGVAHLVPGAGEVASRLVVAADTEQERERWERHFRSLKIATSRELMLVCPAATIGNHPVAQRLVDTTFSLPFHPLLGESEVDRMEKAICSL